MAIHRTLWELEMWGDTGRYMLIPVNTTTCKHTHTLVNALCTSSTRSCAAPSPKGMLEPLTVSTVHSLLMDPPH
jgi:hypothetical protein